MWHALRAELSYFRTHVIVAWSIAAGVATLTVVLNVLGGGEDPSGFVVAGLPGLLLIIASMVVGFIAQGTRSEERRGRLLLAGPVRPRQLGAVMVLLPVCLLGLGALAGGAVLGTVFLATGELELMTVLIVGRVGAQMLAIVQLGPLAQEASAAHRQRRSWVAGAGWAAFVVAILLLVAMQWAPAEVFGIVGQMAVAVVLMVASSTMYTNRTDFTR